MSDTPTPPAIEAIADVSLRQRALEAWRITSELQSALVEWSFWKARVRRRGTLTADESKDLMGTPTAPGALRLGQVTAAMELEGRIKTRLRVLYNLGAVPSLFGRGWEEVLSLVPSLPTGGIDPKRDQEFLQQLDGKLRGLSEFEDELADLIKELETAPLLTVRRIDLGPHSQTTPSDWMTYAEAAKILGRDTSTICNYVKEGKLKSNGANKKKLRVTQESVALLKLKLEEKQGPRTEAGKQKTPPADANPNRPTVYEKTEELRRRHDKNN